MPHKCFGSEIAATMLRAVYDQCRGRYLRPVSFEEVGQLVGLSRDEFRIVADALRASGYARETEDAFSIALEHAGLDWVEYNPPTTDFPYSATPG